MKLLYATSITFPSRRANRLQTIAMAGEFQKLLGNNFYLGGRDIKETSGLRVVNFSSTTKSFLLGWKYARFIVKEGITHVYTREEKLLFFIKFYCALFGKKFVSIYEAHFIPDSNRLFYFILNRVDKIVVLTEIMKQKFQQRLKNKNILVAPDGFDEKLFSKNINSESEKRRLNLPTDKKIILYTGHLYPWKGADILAESAQYLSLDTLVVLVGGTEKDIKSFKDTYGSQKNILIVGHVNHEEIPNWQACADVLILPNSSKEDISKFYTSPLKLFEYMTSGVPIIASDLPSLREILDEDNSVLVAPDNPKKLALAIEGVLSDKDFANRIAKKAKGDVANFSWEKRAHKIVDFIKKF